MTAFGRLTRIACVLAMMMAGTAPVSARMVTDSAGRTVEIPDVVTRVHAAGPPSAILLYVVAPEKMTGWPRAPRQADKPFLLPAVRDLPELGRLTGRGDTVNIERLMAAHPDVIVDFGSNDATYRSLADRIQAQTGIPYLLIDGRFANTAAALRLFGDILGETARGETLARAAEALFAETDRVLATVPEAERPRVYLARAPDGLESGSRGSINTEIIERVGGVNMVSGLRESGGLVRVSPEQIIDWAPDTIVTIDPDVQRAIVERSEWRTVPAVARHRVFLAPNQPFGTLDFPPSVNRLIGLPILLHTLYPGRVGGDLGTEIRAFYRLFYQVELDDAALARLLNGLGG